MKLSNQTAILVDGIVVPVVARLLAGRVIEELARADELGYVYAWDESKHPRVPGGSGDPSGEFMSAVVTTDRSKIRKSLESVEIDQANLTAKIERSHFIDANGMIQEIGTGTKKHVRFTKSELHLLQGKICTHNHPSGGSFSASDLDLASTVKLKELRAYGTRKNGDQWLYRLSPGAGGWPSRNLIFSSTRASQIAEQPNGPGWAHRAVLKTAMSFGLNYSAIFLGHAKESSKIFPDSAYSQITPGLQPNGNFVIDGEVSLDVGSASEPTHQHHSYAQVDYAQIASDLDELELRSRNALLPLLKASRDAMIASVRRVKKPRRLAKVSRDLRLAGLPKIRRVLRAMLRRAWTQGGEDGRAEVGAPRMHAGWDESKHPRNPKGSGDPSGEFAPAGGEFRKIKEGEKVDGLVVRDKIPNQDSISASFNDYEILRGVREVPLLAFDKEYLRSVKPDERSLQLIEQIKDSGEINPLIVAIDSKGTYILEGGHRFDALIGMGAKSFPAMVVIDRDSVPRDQPIKWEYKLHATYASPSFTPSGAVGWMNSKELFITGLLGDQVVGKAKGVLVNAIKTGEAGSVTVEKLWQVFEPFIGDPDVLRDGEPLAPYQLDTIIRTNTTEAYNHGRLNEFVRDDLLPFIDGVRYSAIMDSRTTPVCQFLDGKVFDAESPDLAALLPPNHFNCFISPRTKVFTAKGWRDISSICVGDLVLTHRGRFRSVTFVHHKQSPRIYSGEVIEVALAPDHGPKKILVCTPDHPILTSRGWVAAKDLTIQDRVISFAKKCFGCKKLLTQVAGNGEYARYCSTKCQIEHEYESGTRDRKTIASAAHEKIRQLALDGNYSLSAEGNARRTAGRVGSAKWRKAVTELRRGDLNPMRVHAEIGKRNGQRLVARWRENPKLHGNYSMKNVSAPQRKLFEMAKVFWPSAALEHPLRIGEKQLRFLDVALLEHKIAVEYDGSHWHQDEQKDLIREREISVAGWQVLRYRDRVPSADELRRDVDAILANHNGEYRFAECSIKSIRFKSLRRAVKLYNLSVRGDESYIVGCGVVVHNCRSIVVPIVAGEPVDEADFITDAEVGQAMALADSKFLSEES